MSTDGKYVLDAMHHVVNVARRLDSAIAEFGGTTSDGKCLCNAASSYTMDLHDALAELDRLVLFVASEQAKHAAKRDTDRAPPAPPTCTRCDECADDPHHYMPHVEDGVISFVCKHCKQECEAVQCEACSETVPLETSVACTEDATHLCVDCAKAIKADEECAEAAAEP